MAIYHWKLLSQGDRPVGEGFFRLPTLTIIDYCEKNEVTREDYEKIMILEDLLYPKLRDMYLKRRREEIEKNKQKNKGGPRPRSPRRRR